MRREELELGVPGELLPVDRNVFVMMRYGTTSQFETIEEALRTSLGKYDFRALLAKDRAYADLLWENVKIYMSASTYGIAVFEEIEAREYNPNISIELGFMMAIGKRCLLLKERRMTRLPTDFCGHLYKDFDMFSIKDSISYQIESWMVDLKIAEERYSLARRIRGILSGKKFHRQIVLCLYRNTDGMTFNRIKVALGAKTERLMVELRYLADAEIIRQEVIAGGEWLYKMNPQAEPIVTELYEEQEEVVRTRSQS